MYKTISLVFLWFIAFASFSKDKPEYAVKNIPSELIDDVDALVREESTSLILLPNFKMKRKEFSVVTIFNDRADDLSVWQQFYDNFTSIDFVTCKIYDANGELVKTIKKKDIIDQSMISSISIFEDNRIKALKAQYGIYPYTVELSYQVSSNGFLELPSWYLQTRSRVAVQKSEYDVINTSGLEIDYKLTNLTKKPVETEVEGGKRWSWKFELVDAKEEFESYYPIREQLGKIDLITKEFNYYGYKGSKNSWKDVAQWAYDLQEDRGQIPEDLKSEIRQLTEGKTNEQKIRLVYQWMQKHSRYVSIQLGIGGFQSMLANDVFEKEYGDCKALSNYTQSLLKAADIESLFTLIYGGNENSFFDTKNPSFQFNHAILCVPNEGDTIWLECTSQTNPFGYQGDFTGDRFALICEDGDGRLVRTTSYEAKDNQQLQYTIVNLEEDGNAIVEMKRTSTGIQFQQEDYLSRKSYEEQKKYLYKVLDVPNPIIDSYTISIDKERIPIAKENLTLRAKKVVSKSGDRLFVRPNVANRAGKVNSSKKDRKFDVIFESSFQDLDTVVWNLPKGYTVESLPKAQRIETDFGVYSSNVKTEEGKLIYTREYSLWKGRYKPERYQDFIKFRQQVYKNDKKRVVLKKIKT